MNRSYRKYFHARFWSVTQVKVEVTAKTVNIYTKACGGSGSKALLIANLDTRRT